MTDIYPICQFVAQAHHIDSHTCYILKHLGYSGDRKGGEPSKRWAVTQKLIMAQIAKLCNQMLDCYQLLARGTCQQSYVCFIFVYLHISPNFFGTVTINEYGSLPSMKCIILDDTIFMLTGTMSTPLMWFKSKLMKLVMNGKWEPFCRTASAYYSHCMVIDEAMGLWILHYCDIDTIIKKEDDDIKKEDDGDGIEEEGTSKQEDDNINKRSSETEDNSDDNTENKDGKNQNKKKTKESQSHLCRSGNNLINTFCAKIHLLEVRLQKENLPFNQLSEMIQKQIQESVSKRAWNPIIINDVNELDEDDNIPNASKYMESGFWEV